MAKLSPKALKFATQPSARWERREFFLPSPGPSWLRLKLEGCQMNWFFQKLIWFKLLLLSYITRSWLNQCVPCCSSPHLKTGPDYLRNFSNVGPSKNLCYGNRWNAWSCDWVSLLIYDSLIRPRGRMKGWTSSSTSAPPATPNVGGGVIWLATNSSNFKHQRKSYL